MKTSSEVLARHHLPLKKMPGMIMSPREARDLLQRLIPDSKMPKGKIPIGVMQVYYGAKEAYFDYASEVATTKEFTNEAARFKRKAEKAEKIYLDCLRQEAQNN